jgi:hypothetical protein
VNPYTVRRYQCEDAAQWNAFVGAAKNATFLFHREFMDYHSDRFEDHSLVVSHGAKWIAVLPASIESGALYSHPGLTYGGLVLGTDMKLPIAIGIARSVLRFLDESGIAKLHVRMMPPFYFLKPSDEFLYALFLADAKLVRRDALSVLDLRKPYKFSKDRRKCADRGVKNGLEIREEPEFEKFWDEILVPNLGGKHGVKPVHTAAEMTRLHAAFPRNIRQFNVYDNGDIVAGTTVFVTATVAHPQYISGNERKNELGALDFLYRHLIADVFRDKHFFDLGISNEAQGRKLNEGLVFWKETFGASTVTQDFYDVETANHKLLNDVLL